MNEREDYIDAVIDEAINDACQHRSPVGPKPSKTAALRSPGYHTHRYVIGELYDLEEHLSQVEMDGEEDCRDFLKDVADLQEKCVAMADALDIIHGLIVPNSRLKDTAARLRKPLPTDVEAPARKVVTTYNSHEQFDFESEAVKKGERIHRGLADIVVIDVRTSKLKDKRGLPGYPRPAVNEHVFAEVARQDMRNHPDTVYQRVSGGDKYRFHAGSFEYKRAGNDRFITSTQTGFDANPAGTVHFIASGEKFFRVDTSRPQVLRGATLVAAMKKEPGRIFEFAQGCNTYEAFWDDKKGSIMFRIVNLSPFAQVSSLSFGYTRTDRMFMGEVFGQAVVAKPPIAVRYTEAEKRPEPCTWVDFLVARRDMEKHPGTAYACPCEGLTVVLLAYDGRNWYSSPAPGVWVRAHLNIKKGARAVRCVDEIRGPIHPSLPTARRPNPGRELPNVRR